jgi:BTB/POZ domain-containing protein KCTD9
MSHWDKVKGAFSTGTESAFKKPRTNYEGSCRRLHEEGLSYDPSPPLPERPPRHDDEVLGVNFFRTLVAECTLDGLTLPRTYFGRSEVRSTSFRDTDLTESTANWNDFADVDFAGADLSRADLRGNNLERVSFRATRLTGADMRCCSLTDCDFAEADMRGVRLTRDTGAGLALSDEQRSVIEWVDDDGEEPDGG